MCNEAYNQLELARFSIDHEFTTHSMKFSIGNVSVITILPLGRILAALGRMPSWKTEAIL